MSAAAAAPALVVTGLRVSLRGTGDDIVDDVSFSVQPGEVLGLVGESGSGKTTAGLALLGHARRGAEISAGSVLVGDRDVLKLGLAERRRLRGSVVSYVPAGPRRLAQPGAADRDAAHRGARGAQLRLERRASARERIAEMMREVALPDDAGVPARYPHELSGGQQQRVGARDGVRLPAARDRARRADHRPRRDDPGARARHRARARGRCTASRRSTSATTWPWWPTLADAGGGHVRRAGSSSSDPREELFRSAAPPVHPAADRARSRTSPAARRWSASPAARPRRATGRPAASSRRAAPCASRRVRARRCPTAAAGRRRPHRALHRAPRRCAPGPAGVGARRRPRRCRRRRAGARAPRRRRRLRRPHGRPRRRTSRWRRASAWRSSASRARARRRSPARSRACTSNWTGEILLRGDAARGELARPAARGAARDPVHLPEPVRLAQPAPDDRPDRAPAARAVRRRRQGRDAAGRRDARARRAHRRLRRPLSRPAVRRRAPARRDRPGAGLRSRPCWSATRSRRRST